MNDEKTLKLISKELESDLGTKQENIISSELKGIAKIRLEVVQSLLESGSRISF